MEIWDDELNMDVLNGKPLRVGCDDKGRTRVNKWMLQYY
jgi:hypothetical protein